MVAWCAIWLPVPQVSSPEKDRSKPYPCMDRPCGCASAGQCWKQCCCFTNQQKLAWAESNGVTVPDFVVAAAAQEKTQKTAISRPKCAHCAAATNRSSTTFSVKHILNSIDTIVSVEICSWSFNAESDASEDISCVSRGENSCSSACSDKEQPTLIQEIPSDKCLDSDEASASYFCGIAALECRGLTSLWQILSVTMLPDKACPEVMGQDLMTQVPAFDQVVCSCAWPPPEPPPRIGVAGFRAVQA